MRAISTETPFSGAEFEFLAANVIDDSTGETIFPSYGVRRYQGVSVAFIGLTLQATPTVVSQAAVEGLTFGDEAQVVNALVPRLREQGIEAIVVLLHEGGMSDGGLNDCGSGLDGPVVEVVARLDDAVDMVIAGHTNDEFICRIDGKWVSMADNRGRLFYGHRRYLEPSHGRSHGGEDREPAQLPIRSPPPSPPSQPLSTGTTPSRPLAPMSSSAPRPPTSPAGRTPPASPHWETSSPTLTWRRHEPPTLAARLWHSRTPAAFAATFSSTDIGPGSDGELTYGEAFSVQPFGNSLVTLSLTGAQIDGLLEAQFRDPTDDVRWVLQVSRGFGYTWDATRPVGSRIDPSTISINGIPVDPGATYRIAVNSFLAYGGDGYTVLREGTDRTGGENRSRRPGRVFFQLTAWSLPVHKTGLNASIDCKVAR